MRNSRISDPRARRKFLKNTSLMGAAAVAMPGFTTSKFFQTKPSTMGVASASYAYRWNINHPSGKITGFENALQMLRHCHQIGAGGIQVSSKGWSDDFAGKVRDFREQHDLYLEGSIQAPQDHVDLQRFEVEARHSREAGATILRTACLSGRRYEDFESKEAFEKFRSTALLSLERAEPILAKYKLKLAIENHKDWRVPDLLAILKHLDSEWIGVNLDTGNNISFLEDPLYVVESLAPFTISTHLKDMAYVEYEEGFLLSEVPLGDGVLDLKRIIEICMKSNPQVKFNLEMITRNPLKVPCLKDEYWATFEEVRAIELARMLQTIRQHNYQKALPSVDGQSAEERLASEEKNIVKSFNYATTHLGLV